MSSQKVRANRSKKKINYSYPVLVVYKSNKNTGVTLLEPTTKKTITSFNTNNIKKGTKSEKAGSIGKNIANVLKKKKYTRAVLDRNGYRFTGRVKSMVEAVKAEGIQI